MRLLFLFMDGIGLGRADQAINPFLRANMPCLRNLLSGKNLSSAVLLPLNTSRATLLALDACLGIEGLPQSATGQTALLTGLNVPAIIGYHYGPKPNKEVAAYLNNGNLFSRLAKAGISAALLNAYPPRYFDAIESGHRLPGAMAMAAYRAGIHLMTAEDLYQGNAISADLTGIGWREHLGFADTPLLTPYQAGVRLADLSKRFTFSLFEYWLSDIAGHGQNMEQACNILETFDQALDGLLDSWDDETGLILIVSDHGNLEDLSTRRHTSNPVPLLLIGSPDLRQKFIEGMGGTSPPDNDITHINSAILSLLLPPR
jgi:2,3-bisphosphoglycerate-independent phosphoglycerate mutase